MVYLYKRKVGLMQNISFFKITLKPLILAQYVVLKCDKKSYILHPVA